MFSVVEIGSSIIKVVESLLVLSSRMATVLSLGAGGVETESFFSTAMLVMTPAVTAAALPMMRIEPPTPAQ